MNVDELRLASIEISKDEFFRIRQVARLDLEKTGFPIEAFHKEGKFYLASARPLPKRQWNLIRKKLLG